MVELGTIHCPEEEKPCADEKVEKKGMLGYYYWNSL